MRIGNSGNQPSPTRDRDDIARKAPFPGNATRDQLFRELKSRRTSRMSRLRPNCAPGSGPAPASFRIEGDYVS